MREPGFWLDVIYHDSDLLQLRVTAWNGAFGGATELYVAIGELEQIAVKLAGFPKSFADAREFVLGAFGPEFAGGGVSTRFYCLDRAGHSYLECKIESDEKSAGVLQIATLVMPIEAAAVDRFVEGMRRIGKDRAGTALLSARP
jgi:hypothetical protein